MAQIQTVNKFGKGGSTNVRASPDGLKTMGKAVGAETGTNPNKGYPTSANVSGLQGGSPGVGQSGNGSFGGARGVGGVHMGQTGSGHVDSESQRSSMTGFTPGVVSSKTPVDLKVATYGKKR